MKPTVKQNLIQNSEFKKLVLIVLSGLFKTELDRLTLFGSENYTGIENAADDKLFKFLRPKILPDSNYLHDPLKSHWANRHFVTSTIAMFDDNGETIDIDKNGDPVFDTALDIIKNKYKNSKYLYALAEAFPEDFIKTDKDENGNWIAPAESQD